MNKDRFVLIAAKNTAEKVKQQFDLNVSDEGVLELVELMIKHFKRAMEDKDSFRIPYVASFTMNWDKYRNKRFEDAVREYLEPDQISKIIRNGHQIKALKKIGYSDEDIEYIGFKKGVKLGHKAWKSADKFVDCTDEEIEAIRKELQLEVDSIIRYDKDTKS